jgi:hypothetical protein
MWFARRQRGQVAVETAIVMPLFVFIVLGLLQLGLMHQAHLMAKYASYKAARSGSLNRGDKEVMRRAALSVLLPLTTGQGRDPLVKNVNGSNKYLSAYNDVVRSRSGTDNGVDIAKITICNPTSRDVGPNVDFDDPNETGDEGNDPSWAKFMRTRLAVQVTFNYRLVIPFVNGVLWWVVHGKENLDLLRVLRFSRQQRPLNTYLEAEQGLTDLARQGKYILPIRTNYSMRMFSNFKAGQLPSSNECVIPWKRADP